MGSAVVLRIRVSTADDYDALWELHVASMRPSVEATWGWEGVENLRDRWRGSDARFALLVQVIGSR